MSCDLEKSKVEVVRDALKDVADTIRALDRKVSYIIVITSFMFSGYIYIIAKINSFEKLLQDGKKEQLLSFLSENFFLFVPIILFIIALVFLFKSYDPVSNPTQVLSEEDKKFPPNLFFYKYTTKICDKSENLATNFLNQTTEIKGILQILYIEICKLSYIRDRKLGLIKIANALLFTGFLVSILFLSVQLGLMAYGIIFIAFILLLLFCGIS